MEYPDLQIFTMDEDLSPSPLCNISYKSKRANGLVNDFDVCEYPRGSKGGPKEVYVRPFLRLNGFKIYSNPEKIYVGTSSSKPNQLNLEIEEEEFLSLGIPKQMAETIIEYFNKPFSTPGVFLYDLVMDILEQRRGEPATGGSIVIRNVSW